MSGPMSGRPQPGGGGAGMPDGRPGAGGPAAAPRGPRGGPMAMMMGGPPPEKSKDFGKSFRRLLGRLQPERTRVILVLLLAIGSVAFAVIGPKVLGNATNLIFEGAISAQLPAGSTQAQVEAGLRASGQTQLADMLHGMTIVPGVGIDFNGMASILTVLVVLFVISAVFGWAQAYIMAGVTQRTVYRLRQEVDVKLGRLPLKYFDDHSRGDVLSRVTNDIDNIGQTLQQSLTQLITSVMTVIGVLVVMLFISWELALISVLAIPLSLFLTVIIIRRSQRQFVAQWASTGALNGQVEEVHTGHNIVTVFGRQKEAAERFEVENERLYQAAYRAQFISGIIQPALSLVSNLNYVAIAVIGGLRVATGQMNLGDVVAFIQYSRQFSQPIVQAASIANVLQSAVASAERVFELLDEPEMVADPVDAPALGEVAGKVAFEGVSFRYREDTPLIEDLSLTAEPGATVAIVGPTGAGKTTLVNLLMRFYEIDAGKITIDGIDTCSVRREDVRREFGMVLQDTWLFHGTIRDNIAYGRADATETEIIAAAEEAHVDHFVRTLPAGYDTVIDDDATNLSQGEKQLLTIARAFLADPRILILDEATSSVDTRTEVLIQRAMAKLMADRTTFVIAHRLSTIRDADLILVMDHGKIIETGTHKELLDKGGFYNELYQSQFVEGLAQAA
jgi:ATP-binding cassette subfamily B multidrug efflux pump